MWYKYLMAKLVMGYKTSTMHWWTLKNHKYWRSESFWIKKLCTESQKADLFSVKLSLILIQYLWSYELLNSIIANIVLVLWVTVDNVENWNFSNISMFGVYLSHLVINSQTFVLIQSVPFVKCLAFMYMTRHPAVWAA